jgi:valyl-tRNA synthetase
MHGEMKLLVPLADLIDIEDEIKRLSKKISSTIKEIEKSRLKLNNENFISNAPPEIVKQEKSRIQENEILISELNIQIDKLRK